MRLRGARGSVGVSRRYTAVLARRLKLKLRAKANAGFSTNVHDRYPANRAAGIVIRLLGYEVKLGKK